MKKFYVSFGQIHTHIMGDQMFDRDCIAEIRSESREEAHEKAFELFGYRWSMLYDNIPDMSYFPRGIIEIS